MRAAGCRPYILQDIIQQPRRLRGAIFRALVFRALVFRALVFRTLVFRALVFRTLVFRALRAVNNVLSTKRYLNNRLYAGFFFSVFH